MPPEIDPPAPAPAGGKKDVLAKIQADQAEIMRVQKAILEGLKEWQDYEGYDIVPEGTYHGIKF